MTSQVLISNRLSENSAVGTESSRSPEVVKKLPYQANHQVELLNLQAETEALLQQLRLLKQQRSISMDAEGSNSILSLESAIHHN